MLMAYRPLACLLFAGLFFPGVAPRPATAQSTAQSKTQSKAPPTIWNYDGGIVMMSDGSLFDGPCFRISGKLTASEFFEGMKRLDSTSGIVYRRGNDVVTFFPNQLHLTFVMYDIPCDDKLQRAGSRIYLSPSLMSTLRISFFWKRGMELRPVAGVQPKNFQIQRIDPYAKELAKELPEKFEWWFEYDVPSEGVPLTDSLVIILRTADHHERLAARVAARM